MLNPSDPIAASQFAALLAHDAAAQETLNRPGPSSVTEAVVGSFKRKKNRGDVAGYVVLFMADLEAAGEPVSLGRAQAVTEVFLGEVDAEFKAGIPQSQRDIRKHFDHYRDVAHLWAAKIHFPEKWEAAPASSAGLFDFLSHAKLLQHVLHRNLNAQTPWNPWRIPDAIALPGRGWSAQQLKSQYIEASRQYTRRGGA